ncbi:hypothetical protein RCL1_004958 [Eukaryota sp. TZLM3-RCL]
MSIHSSLSASSVTTSSSLNLLVYPKLTLHPASVSDVLLILVSAFCFPRSVANSPSSSHVDSNNKRWPMFSSFYRGHSFTSSITDLITNLSSSLVDQMTADLFVKFGTFVGRFPFSLDIDGNHTKTEVELRIVLVRLISDFLSSNMAPVSVESLDSLLEVHVGTEPPIHWFGAENVQKLRRNSLLPTPVNM